MEVSYGIETPYQQSKPSSLYTLRRPIAAATHQGLAQLGEAVVPRRDVAVLVARGAAVRAADGRAELEFVAPSAGALFAGDP